MVISRRAGLVGAAQLLTLAGCAPVVRGLGKPSSDFSGPKLLEDRLIATDGTPLALTSWVPRETAPWAVVVGLHGMNDYGNAFHLAAQWWAQHGVATLALDQRGFGRSPDRGFWAGEDAMVQDARTLVDLARITFPKARILLAGISMGGAVAIRASVGDQAARADGLMLFAPAVWGWSRQPLPNKTLLWLTAHTTPGHQIKPPEFVINTIKPTDNRAELLAMTRDRNLIWGTRPDAIYGLTNLMESAWSSTDQIQMPTAYFYGAKDQIIPRKPSFEAAARLKAPHKTAYYDDGYHLLLVDNQAPRVWADALGFMRDPTAPLGSSPALMPPPKKL
jgi:acylglycerol lipase